jgi:hypothetical protein
LARPEQRRHRAAAHQRADPPEECDPGNDRHLEIRYVDIKNFKEA